MNLCSCKRRRRKIFLKLIPMLAEQRNGGIKGTPSRIQSRCSRENRGCFCGEGKIIAYIHHWLHGLFLDTRQGMYGGNECVKLLQKVTKREF
jgi:hypothetical protein